MTGTVLYTFKMIKNEKGNITVSLRGLKVLMAMEDISQMSTVVTITRIMYWKAMRSTLRYSVCSEVHRRPYRE